MRCILAAPECEVWRWQVVRKQGSWRKYLARHDEEHFLGHRALTCLHKPLTESDKLHCAGWERVRVPRHLQCHWTPQRDQHSPLCATHSHGEEDRDEWHFHAHGTEDSADTQALVPASSDNASNTPVTAPGSVTPTAVPSGLQQLPMAFNQWNSSSWARGNILSGDNFYGSVAFNHGFDMNMKKQ